MVWDINKVGASWFVSYMYYDRIDGSHLNWNNSTIKTIRLRKSLYNKASNLDKENALRKVLDMNKNKLNKNTFGLTGKQVKLMAKELLELNEM